MFYQEKYFPQMAMTTDVFICAFSDKFKEKTIEADIDRAFKEIKKFERNYSRFVPTSYISKLNKNGYTRASEELLDILDKSFYYNKITNGLFDIFILNDLLSEGYILSKDKNFYQKNIKNIESTKKLVDLGGIGKGYLIDKIKNILGKKYTNFCIDIGGDIYCAGINPKEKENYWFIDIEDPFTKKSVNVLKIINKAIATSGINKRTWLKGGEIKNHIIDPRTKKSLDNDLITSTVISNNAVEADIFAKILLIMGVKKSLDFSKKNKVASLLIAKDQNIHISHEMRKYLYYEI